MLDTLGQVFNTVLVQPMLNGLILLYGLLFHNFGLSIILFTILVRLATMPLTMRQLRSMKAMTSLQPKLAELQKKYAKDRQKLSQEQMRMYKQAGVNPLGCLGPMVIQFPIWIGLYYSIMKALTTTPESLLDLSQSLYTWLPWVHELVPLNNLFLWLNLGLPDSNPLTSPILPVLVGASMWVQQKMTTMPTADPRQSSTNKMMLWMMPLMFGFFTFSFPSGLAIYWVASNLIGIVIQYFVTGWGGLLPSKPAPAPALQPVKEAIPDGKRGNNGEDSGGGDRASLKRARRKQRRGRDTGPQQGKSRDPGDRGGASEG